MDLNYIFAASCGIQHRVDGGVHAITSKFGPAAAGRSISMDTGPAATVDNCMKPGGYG